MEILFQVMDVIQLVKYSKDGNVLLPYLDLLDVYCYVVMVLNLVLNNVMMEMVEMVMDVQPAVLYKTNGHVQKMEMENLLVLHKLLSFVVMLNMNQLIWNNAMMETCLILMVVLTLVDLIQISTAQIL